MSRTTEFAVVTLKEGASPSSFDKPGSILKQQEGCLELRGGLSHEDPSKYFLIVDWESIEVHSKFMTREEFKPFLELVLANVAGKPSLYHVNFKSYPLTVLENHSASGGTNVAEVLHMHFPADISDEGRAAVEKTAQDFLGQLTPDKAPGFSGQSAMGWAVEEVELKGEKTRALVALLGWESIDAHIKFRDTEHFKNIIPLLRDIKDLKGIEMCHVTVNKS
jgi:quinol monooxygenase YgiN